MNWLRSIWSKTSKSSARPASPLGLFRPLRAEPLEPRHLMAVNVFLDFGDASGDNSFADRLQELANTDGRIPFTPAEINQLRTNIAAAVQNAFAEYGVVFSQSLPTGSFETLGFGRTKDVVLDAPDRFGHAELDWLNINQTTNPGEATAYVFPAEFTKADLANPAPAAYLNRLGNALAFWGVHELGHAFGLENQDAFGDVSIIPDVYANTFGVQNRNFMAVPAFGLAATQFDSFAGFAFSPLSRAKLGFAANLTASPLATTPETTLDHDTAATAQVLVFRSLASASAQVVDVELASTSIERDFYKFNMQVGELLTINTLATNVYEHTLDPSDPFSFDTVIRLFKPDGTTVVMTADDIRTGVNKFGGSTGTTLLDQDSLIVNYRIPEGAGGTYYVEVTSKTQTPGFYDLLVAKWTPTLPPPWQNPVRDFRDVTNDGAIVARDALRVINEINRLTGGGRRLPNPVVGAERPVVVIDGITEYFYFDVNGDNFVTAIDALQIINYINNPSPPPPGGEGEGDSFAADHSSGSARPEAAVDDSFAAFGAWWMIEDSNAAVRGRKK
ncbi:MAG: dockerin type I domain-containing protein [Pirellulaceae bacterium]